MHPGQPCARRSPATVFHVDEGRGLQRRAIVRQTVSMWRPPPSGRMDRGIRGHAALIVNGEKRGERSWAKRAWWGVYGRRRDGRRTCERAHRSYWRRQSANHRSTIESRRWTTRLAPRYSRHPPVPARPSVPFTLPRSFPSPTQAGRAATDVSLFDPPAPAASAHV